MVGGPYDMKTIERFLSVAATGWCIGFFFLPKKIVGVTGMGLFFAVGLWSLLYPQGLLGWASTAHHEIDPSDPTLWWVPRVIGVCFIIISALGFTMMASS